MTTLHKYIRNFLDESEVKFVKIFDREKLSSTRFFLASNVIYESSVSPEFRDVCTIMSPSI